MINQPKKIYDGKQYCSDDCCCPIAEQHGNTVLVFDPTKPEKGRFEFTIDEYNAFLKNAPLVQ